MSLGWKFLIEFAQDLQKDQETMARAEVIKEQILAHPDVQRLIGSAWTTAKGMLLSAAEGWLAQRGCEKMVGPADFSMNDESGILIEGFELEPMIRQPWHPPYYQRLMEDAGMAKAPAGTLYRGREGMWSWVAHRVTGVLIFFFLFVKPVE